MAKGIKPIINNFWGSKQIWLPETIFDTIDKIPKILSSEYLSTRYKQHIVDNYSLDKVVKQIEEIL